MQTYTPGEISQLLVEMRSGSQTALNSLFPVVYDELRKTASSYLHHEYEHRTLQTCELVHEAYMKLAGHDVTWQNRAHFFGIAANVMRQILVDEARRRHAAKRGGGMTRVSLGEDVLIAEDTVGLLLMLDEALTELQKFDERLCKVVELRYFSGLTVEETAEVLSVSPRTVKHDWSLARAWLHRAIHT
jgi:RNA polymerase sigma factor (TIGR02999 family)